MTLLPTSLQQLASMHCGPRGELHDLEAVDRGVDRAAEAREAAQVPVERVALLEARLNLLDADDANSLTNGPRQQAAGSKLGGDAKDSAEECEALRGQVARTAALVADGDKALESSITPGRSALVRRSAEAMGEPSSCPFAALVTAASAATNPPLNELQQEGTDNAARELHQVLKIPYGPEDTVGGLHLDSPVQQPHKRIRPDAELDSGSKRPRPVTHSTATLPSEGEIAPNELLVKMETDQTSSEAPQRRAAALGKRISSICSLAAPESEQLELSLSAYRV